MLTPTATELKENLSLPVFAAPMFLISNGTLAAACCKAGIVGSIPALNARTSEGLEQMITQTLTEIADFEQESGRRAGPLAINISLRTRGTDRFTHDVAIMQKHRIPIIITSVGNPAPVVEKVHAYGGLVFHDVINVHHAKRAIEAGVDGLILICAGAGGHAGQLSPFAFVRQVRAFYSGLIIVAGGISSGSTILSAQVLGADFVYMGTRFIVTEESQAKQEYKDMIIQAGCEDILCTDSFSSLKANYLIPSIKKVGMDPDNLPAPIGLWKPNLPEGIRAWRDVWSAGQGVGTIERSYSVDELVQVLTEEYQQAKNTVLNQVTLD